MQVKFIIGGDVWTLEDRLNSFLRSLQNAPTDVKYDMDSFTAIVEYEEVRHGAICCECKFWDDGGSHDELIGLCQRCGGRKRFSDKACNKYEDVRE